ncbi:hypothetical protein LTR84_007862 [Exophiala bonariae]|uniref:Tcp11-domain-containing protein n=1 Tax=Exophiala bonariae TaxID=1690606 RepID=A0AAV9NQC2_9EURO|nr:hypothetical protein LTR84_007862 [Exophiala bonariae]
MKQNAHVQRFTHADNSQDATLYSRRQYNTGTRKFPEEQSEPPQPNEVRCLQPSTADVSNKEIARGGNEPGNRIIIPPCISKADVQALLNAPYQPPVTKASLRELDLTLIQSNINLRVDLNYDHDLHFTPVSGLKGEKKKLKAVLYWQSLVAEFRITQHYNSLQTCSECKAISKSGGDVSTVESKFYPRLPDLFLNLKELLTILVPDRDQDQISEYLDIPLLTQMATYGVINVVGLGKWLCELLTTHCAPMRDIYAQEMAEKIREGFEQGSMEALVDGIKKLFDFLEAMKLDVANHQIRSFRYHLIEDTVAFQKDHFRVRIRNKRFNVKEPRKWFLKNVNGHHQSCKNGDEFARTTPLHAMLHGLVDLCVNADSNFPETLKHDVPRLGAMRDQIQDIIHINICLLVFDEQIKRLVGSRFNPSDLHPILGTRIKDLQSRILDLTDGHMNPNETMAQMWSQHCGAIALELTNAAFSVCKRVGCFLPDSEIETTARNLQMQFDDERLNGCRAQEFATVLEGAAQAHAHVFDNMTTLNISEIQKRHHNIRQGSQHEFQQWRQMPTEDDMARKLAHIAVIHMRVWADMVYLTADGEQDVGVEVE